MAQQVEFLKNVRENLSSVQAKAAARFETLNGSALKVLSDVVEKGKAQQKDLSSKLSSIEQRVKPVAEVAIKRVSEAREKASVYVNTASRGQAAAVAGGLRKVAARLEQIGQKTDSATPSAQA